MRTQHAQLSINLPRAGLMFTEEDEINVPLTLGVFRDKGS